MTLSLSERAGSYLLDQEIARGGFGVVHRARHVDTGHVVAVKVLHAGKAGDASAIARFEREVEVVLALAHPHVVEIFEHGQLDDGRPYFAMELLCGVTVAEQIAARGRLSVDEALAILEPLAGALDAAHARGIVHRDVKPPNVFLADARPQGRVVLLDFGVAKLRDGLHPTLTGARDALGTLDFMAPEQLVSSRVDARADVYALGALAYVMLTGQPPFAETGARLLRQIRERAHPAPPSARASLDPALDAPIVRALWRDVEGRTASVGAFVTALRAAARAPERATRPAGTIARRSIAVHAEVRAVGAEDDAQLAELESALPAVSAELSAAGLVVVHETATRLLHVGGDADPQGRQRAVAAAVKSYERFVAGPGRHGRVALGIAVHEGELLVAPDRALLDGGLLDVPSWLAASPAGVIASREALGAIDEPRTPVPGAPGFFWLAR